MSVRRDNRAAGGVGTPSGPHAKLTHDRHNQELLKRLATHTTHSPKKPTHAMPGKGPLAEGVASPGGRAGLKAGPSKSLLRPTSSSAMKAACGAQPAPRRQDSNKRPRPAPTRKADAPARRGHARPATPPDKEEKDLSEAKLQQDSLPETPDKDSRDAPTPTPAPTTPTPASTAPTPSPTTPSPGTSPLTPAPVITGATNVAPSTSAPGPAPAHASSIPPSGPQQRHEAGGKACVRPAAGRGGGVVLEAVCPPSREEVLRGVRARVGGEARRVEDADKDVCEAAGDEDEEEFYRVRVKTRLVTYDNNTLVIRNTSAAPHEDPPPEAPPSEAAPDAPSQQHTPVDTQQVSQQDTDPEVPPTPALTSAPPQVSPSTVADAPIKEEPPHAHSHALAPAMPLSQAGAAAGVKRRLTLLVNRGRSFLAGVYSATQSRLEQYVNPPRPPRPHATPQPLLVEVNPLWVAQHLPQAQWMPLGGRERSGVPLSTPLPTPHTPEGAEGREVEAGGDEGGGAGVDAALDVEVDDEWIRKNILCTCKCRCVAEEKVEQKKETNRRRRKVHKQGDGLEGAGLEEGENRRQEEKKTDTVKIEEKDESVKKEKEFTENKDKNEGIVTEDDEGEEKCKKMEENVKVDEERSKKVKEEMREETKSKENIGQVAEEEEEEKEEEEDLCYCSCHEGERGSTLPHLPAEVQELLDADHARMWWTITGNFGNILPIDWSKTYTRQQYLPVLNLNEMKEGSGGGAEEGEGGTEKTEAGDGEREEEEEEEVAQDLDLHHLILNGLTAEPVKSAEEVIQEIDDIMQEGSSSEDEGVEESTSSGENMQDPPPRPCPPHLYHDKLKSMSVSELNEALMELELVIRQYSETLITQLALRDELEYEKELKNSFISLLLQVQNKRRNYNVEKKKQKKVGPNGMDPKYLTTVIPYDAGHGPPHNPTLQILIKILTAINEDSPTVPTLLTDYILKVEI